MIQHPRTSLVRGAGLALVCLILAPTVTEAQSGRPDRERVQRRGAPVVERVDRRAERRAERRVERRAAGQDTQVERRRVRERATDRPEMRPRGAERRPFGRRGGMQRPRALSPEVRARIVERFDRDGSGVLEADERSRAREAMRRRLGEARPGAVAPEARGRQGGRTEVAPRAGRTGAGRTGAGRSGEGQSGIGRPGAALRAGLLKRFDADGSGALEGEERARARAALRERFPEGRVRMQRPDGRS